MNLRPVSSPVFLIVIWLKWSCDRECITNIPGMMAKFRCQFDWAIGCPGWTAFLDVSVSVFMDHCCCSLAKSCLTHSNPMGQASLATSISQSLLRLMSFESVMLSNHLILCHHLPPLLSTFPSISLFQWVVCFPQVASVLEPQLQHQSFQWIFRTDFL